MGSKRATLEAVSRALIEVGIVIPEMQIHPSTKKSQSNGRHLSIISISLGWTDNHAYETFVFLKSSQSCYKNVSVMEMEALIALKVIKVEIMGNYMLVINQATDE